VYNKTRGLYDECAQRRGLYGEGFCSGYYLRVIDNVEKSWEGDQDMYEGTTEQGVPREHGIQQSRDAVQSQISRATYIYTLINNIKHGNRNW